MAIRNTMATTAEIITHKTAKLGIINKANDKAEKIAHNFHME
jgi:hypothetical protein